MTTLPSEARKLPEYSAQRESSLGRLRRSIRSLVVGVSLLLPQAVHADEPRASPPVVSGDKKMGTLVIVGGSNRLPDGSYRTEIEDLFLELVERVGGEQADIVVMPTASTTAENEDADHFFRPKKRPASLKKLHTRSRDMANTSTFTEPIRKAAGVWVAGGKQPLWVAAYSGTLVEQELHDVVRRGGAVGLTSAGAALVGENAILGGNPAEMGVGIGMVRGGVFDMHLDRGRLPRLLDVVKSRPGCVGFGLDADTAFIVQGTRGRVFGIGNMRICVQPSGEEPSIQVLSDGDVVDLHTLKVTIVPNEERPASADVTVGAP